MITRSSPLFLAPVACGWPAPPAVSRAGEGRALRKMSLRAFMVRLVAKLEAATNARAQARTARRLDSLGETINHCAFRQQCGRLPWRQYN